jgi:NAD(P)-dependent dehydrogenase (short-subunit alcohol dehydrogenase family)
MCYLRWQFEELSGMSDPLDLTGKVVLVTGGGKGVGRGITESFLACGASVVVCSRNEPETLPACGTNVAVFITCNVKDPDQIEACIADIMAQFGRLDVLVNNVGGTPYTDAAAASPRFTANVIGLNLVSPMIFSEAANKVMQGQDSGGCIVNISSVSAVRPSPGTAAYGAAKAALIALGESQAQMWSPRVRVNSIIVGLVKTEQSHLHYGDEAGVAAVASTIPLERMADPQDIGNACVYLASPVSGSSSGTCLTVHGGGEKPSFLDAANSDH